MPFWMIEKIQQARCLFIRARAEELAGNHELAEDLRNQAESIYDELLEGLTQAELRG